MISDLSFIMIMTLVVLIRGCSHIVICDQGKLVGGWGQFMEIIYDVKLESLR